MYIKFIIINSYKYHELTIINIKKQKDRDKIL